MGAFVEISISTGRSQCAICKSKIVKGLEQISFVGWNCSAKVHRDKRKCKSNPKDSI